MSVKVLSREGNSAVLDIQEVIAGRMTRTKYRETLYPKERAEAEYLEGMLAGTIEIKLTETSQGTQIDWFYHLTPRTALAKLLRVFVGRRVMQGIANEFNKQLAEYAEAHP